MTSRYQQRAYLGAFLVCGVTMLLVGSPAFAAKHSRVRVALSVGSSGQRLSVRIAAKHGSRCTVRVAVKRSSMSLPAVILSRAGRATVAWTVPVNAPSGKWVFAVSCRVGRITEVAKRSLFLINHGDGRGVLVEADSMRFLEGTLGGKGAGPCGALAAPDQNGHCVSFPGDPFNYYEGGSDIGQCTWYAAGRRPDLWGIVRGNAKTWLKEAAGHMAEGSLPVPGAIAVDTNGAWGHVAYVVGVSGSNVIVDDSNYWNDLTVHYAHPILAGNFAGYIYGGPAGAGPGSGGGGGPSGGTEPPRAPPPVPGGFDGHGLSEIAVYRRSDQTWHIRGVGDFQYGQPGDIPVPGNYDPSNPSLTDLAVYRPSEGTWHIRGVGDFQYGQVGDIPVPASYNPAEPGVTQIAVYRPSDGTWHVRGYGDFPTYGQPGDVPVPGNYDPSAPARTDIAVYRPSDGTWHVRGVGDFKYGEPGDRPVPGAYNPAQPGVTEIAVYRPNNGTWHVRTLGDYEYGEPGDIPVPGNFNASSPSTTEIAVYRPSNGTWHIRTVGDYEYGEPEDIPITDPLNAEQLVEDGFVSSF